MLITLKSFLDNLHVSESELINILENNKTVIQIDSYSLRLRAKAEVYTKTFASPWLFQGIPKDEAWIFWAAAMMNDSRAAEPYVKTIYPSNTNLEFVWPTISTGAGPPGAGEWGSIVDPAFYPQVVIGSGDDNYDIWFEDKAYVAGDNISLNTLFTRIKKDVII